MTGNRIMEPGESDLGESPGDDALLSQTFGKTPKGATVKKSRVTSEPLSKLPMLSVDVAETEKANASTKGDKPGGLRIMKDFVRWRTMTGHPKNIGGSRKAIAEAKRAIGTGGMPPQA